MEKTIFILWLVIIILQIYMIYRTLKLKAKLDNDLKELEECEDLFNIEYEDYDKITFNLIPDEKGTIFDKEGNSYRLERNNEHRK